MTTLVNMSHVGGDQVSKNRNCGAHLRDTFDAKTPPRVRIWCRKLLPHIGDYESSAFIRVYNIIEKVNYADFIFFKHRRSASAPLKVKISNSWKSFLFKNLTETFVG